MPRKVVQGYLKWIVLFVIPLLLVAVSCSGGLPTGPSDNTGGTNGEMQGPITAITHVSVVDVEGGISRPDQTVLLNSGRIARIAASDSLTVPSGAQVIDGSGQFLIPGLVDAHVHLYDPPTFGRMLLAYGVLLVRDMGQPNEIVLPLRDGLNTATITGPEMVATGWILDGAPALIPLVSKSCTTPDQGRAMVDQQAKAGVDEIKVYSGLNKDVYLAIVDEAKRKNLKAVGHIPEAVYLEEAATAGQKSAEHLFGFEKVIGKLLGKPIRLEPGGMAPQADYWLLYDQVDKTQLRTVLERVRSSGMAVCPTVIVFRSGASLKEVEAGRHPLIRYISPKVMQFWRAMWPAEQQDTQQLGQIWGNMQSFVGELQRAGVTLMTGTDLSFPGIIPGDSLHEEMAIWQEGGVPAADILRSATILPARFMGLDSRLGTVAEGKEASIVLLRANPLEDIRNAREIEAVFQRGKYYSRADLDKMLAEVVELAKP